jgi:4-hydroxy-4-methyl-2-oxoglutarate aldolase
VTRTTFRDAESRRKSGIESIPSRVPGSYTEHEFFKMAKTQQLPPEILEFLRHTDTCTVSNAIETLNVRMRNEGFVYGGARCLFPELPPVAGYAVTGSIRTSAPPISGLCYYQRTDWWQHLAGIPGPKIIVMEDLDGVPGIGALFGEIHAQIGRALGCVGYLTNGTVRDLGAIRALGFHCFANGTSVSHSYAHVVEFGVPVHIGGLKISTGDLLHGDLNGIHSVPAAVTDRLPGTVRKIKAHEAELIRICQARDFSIEKLQDALRDSGKWNPQPAFR